MSSEEEYTTDDLSSEEDHQHQRPPVSAGSAAAPSSYRKSTATKPRRWQPLEDRLLTAAVNQCGEANWKSIAAKVGSRNHVQCLQRWKKVLRPGLVKGQWDAEEDAALMKLATAPFKNWGTLSTQMSGRTSKQCRERWCHHLNPDINKGPYTRQEDETILKVHDKLGNKWSLIAAKLPGRTENSIKIRCKALQRKTGGGGSGRGGSGRGGGKPTPAASPRPVKKSAGTSTTALLSPASSPVVSGSSSPCWSSGEGEVGGMAVGQPQQLSERSVAAAAADLAQLPPQRRIGSSSRGLKFEPLFVGPGDSPLLPVAAPRHGGALSSAPDSGSRHGGRFGVKQEPLEWPPSGDLKDGEMFFIGSQHQHQHHQHQHQQQQQHHHHQRYQPIPSPAQQFLYGARPVRNDLFGSGGGGGSSSGCGGGGGERMFDSRLTPTGAYLGQPRQQQLLPLGHFAPQPSAPALGQGPPQEVYPDQRHQGCLIDDDDGELEAEALAAVGAADLNSAAAAASAAANMATLARGIASLEEMGETLRAASGGGGQEAVVGGQPGDVLEAGVGVGVGMNDRDEGAEEEGNGPLRSCCSFLALNEQDNIVGDADSWQEEGKDHYHQGHDDDDDDDGGGALMME